MVYVDRGRIAYGRMRMSHMLADSLDELHAMAARLGLKREWFQPLSTPHYDICRRSADWRFSTGRSRRRASRSWR